VKLADLLGVSESAAKIPFNERGHMLNAILTAVVPTYTGSVDVTSELPSEYRK
jgi:hypothetical protein